MYAWSTHFHTTRTTVIDPPRGVARKLNICRSQAIILARTSGQTMTTPSQDTEVGKNLPGQPQRAPIEQEMELKFSNFELLVTAVSANISTAGMFILSSEPAPVGTTFSFRFRIEDWSPIQGTVRVIWNRELDEASDRPAGMGVAFVDVDAQSRRMIRYLVDKHLAAGGEPFDLGNPIDIPSDSEADRPSTSTGSTASEPHSNRLLWFVGALLMVGVISVGLWFQWTRPPVYEGQPTRAMVRRGQTGVSGPVAGSPSEGDSDSVLHGNRQAEEAIQQLVEEWSEAWESGRPDELLAFYAPDFKPSGRETRAEWEARLKREMSNTSFIRVAISALEISAPTAAEGQASFYQSIRSDQRDETVRTTLDVVRMNDGWKILRQANSR